VGGFRMYLLWAPILSSNKSVYFPWAMNFRNKTFIFVFLFGATSVIRNVLQIRTQMNQEQPSKWWSSNAWLHNVVIPSLFHVLGASEPDRHSNSVSYFPKRVKITIGLIFLQEDSLLEILCKSHILALFVCESCMHPAQIFSKMPFSPFLVRA
jgi:hypothetical protein